MGPLKNSIDSYRGIKFTNQSVRCLGIFIGHDKAGNCQKNWYEKMEKIKILFERWKNRNLTIFGKILVIKTLAISKLIHAMSILAVPEEFLKDIEKLIFGFLWESKDRIKRKTLIGPKGKGGIKMLDIYCKNKSLKAGWLRRLNTENTNSLFINMYLNKINIDVEYMVKTTCTNIEHIQKLLKIPVFWAQVFGYSNECKSTIDKRLINKSELLAEPLWLNNRLKISKKTILLSNWTKSGILFIKDIFDNTGEIISEHSLLKKLICKSNWIAEFLKVKKALKWVIDNVDTSIAGYIQIKKTWVLLHNNSTFCMKTQNSKFYYDILIDKKFESNYMEKTWDRILNLDNIRWCDVYKEQVWNLTDKKLAEFNYKLICNIVTTRSQISRWNQDINENCTFCNEKQTIRHLIFDCVRVQNLWTLIGSILKLNITYKHLIIGDRTENEYIRCRNLVISYAKYAIYKFWILSENKKLNFNNDSLHAFVKRDLFRRTLFLKENNFSKLCDKIIQNM